MERLRPSRSKGYSLLRGIGIPLLAGSLVVAGGWVLGQQRGEERLPQGEGASWVAAALTPETIQSVFLAPEELRQGNLILTEGTVPVASPDSLTQVEMPENGTYQLGGEELYLDEDCLRAFQGMMEEYVAATGNNQLLLSDGYRSISAQSQLAATGGEGCRQDPPGTSEHHTGLALDLAQMTVDGPVPFTGEGVQGWIAENGPAYGFITRYPAGKEEITGHPAQADHLRYVGIPHGQVMEELGLCLEEYWSAMEGYTVDHPYRTATPDGFTWQIYYVPAQETGTQIQVPKNSWWEVSGDNQAGFLITVRDTLTDQA